VILYQLLTGQLPFDDEDARRLMRKQIESHPPGPPPFVPTVLRTILGKLLAKRPDLRYANATEAIVALRTARTRLPPDRTQRVALLQDGAAEPQLQAETIRPGANAPGLDGIAGRLEKLLHQETPLALQALHEGIGEGREPWNIDIDSLDLDALGDVAEATQRRR
jgi:serine/threonine protein kinase